MSEPESPISAHGCQRYIRVQQFPKGYWRARMIDHVRKREFIGLPKPTMLEAIRAAYSAAGDPNGMGIPIFDHRGIATPEPTPYDARRWR